MRCSSFARFAFVSVLIAAGMLVWTNPSKSQGTVNKINGLDPRTPIGSLPFTINRCGSYYLTRCLTATSGHGIEISSDDVTVDLNGFTLKGAGGNGIQALGTRSNVVIKNGVIRGWSAAVNMGTASYVTLEDLRAIDGSNGGFKVGDSSRLLRCSSKNSGHLGFDAGSSSTLIDCLAEDSTQWGFQVLESSSMVRCTSLGAGEFGIRLGEGGSIVDSVSNGSTNSGYLLRDGVTATRCSASNNQGSGFTAAGSTAGQVLEGCTAIGNMQAGFSFVEGTILRSCTSIANGLTGISAGDGALVKDCVVRGNMSGISVDDGGTIMGCVVVDCSAGNGITLGSDCHAYGNTCHSNVGAGIGIINGFRNRVGSNLATQNTTGYASSGTTAGNLFIGNHASGNTSEYALSASNNYGAIIFGGAGFADDNPWTNHDL